VYLITLPKPCNLTYRNESTNVTVDSGVLGILDKLICVKAQYFVGCQGKCAKHSSYSAAIVQMREELGLPSQLYLHAPKKKR